MAWRKVLERQFYTLNGPNTLQKLIFGKDITRNTYRKAGASILLHKIYFCRQSATWHMYVNLPPGICTSIRHLAIVRQSATWHMSASLLEQAVIRRLNKDKSLDIGYLYTWIYINILLKGLVKLFTSCTVFTFTNKIRQIWFITPRKMVQLLRSRLVFDEVSAEPLPR